MREKIGKSRFEFLIFHPFLGELSLRLQVREDSSIPTMCTDMKHLLYNPKFVEPLDPKKELMGVIAHEIAHCVFGHAGLENVKRASEKNREIWTIACEFMANHFVIDLVNLPLPGKYFYDKKYSDGSWTTESIYYDLLKNAQEGGKSPEGNQVDDHSQWGKGKENGAGKDKEGKSAGGASDGVPSEQEWKVWIAQAAHNAKRQGKFPAGLERLVGTVLDARLNWRQVLAEFLLNRSKDDYTWKRPNKRHLWRDIYAPSLHSESINIGYAMDTSGSMSEQELAEGLAEIRAISSAFPSYRLHLFACDAQVHHYQEATPVDEIDVKGLCRGGGGTSFVPVFDKIREDDIKLDALVYFTDAYGTFGEEPEYPVLWVVKGNGPTPFGRRIEYDA